MTRSRHPLVDRTLCLAAELRPRVLQRMTSAEGGKRLQWLAEAVALATGNPLNEDEFAQMYAEAVACGSAAAALAGPLFRERRVQNWLLNHANPLWRGILEEALPLSREHDPGASAAAVGGVDPILAFYEVFLQHHDQRRRTRHGVFYTPPPIARYILSQVQGLLRERFGLAEGLAESVTWGQMASRFPSLVLPATARPADPFVTILDPALGAGVFLAEGLKFIHAHLTAQWARAGESDSRVAERWDDCVARYVLPRLFGLELMLPACVVATLKLVSTLAETGFTFTRDSQLQISLANTLAGPPPRQRTLCAAGEAAFLTAAGDGRESACRTPFTVIVGNPPFSGISQQHGPWIVDLLRGTEGSCRERSNYFEVDGRPLGERKTWLQDDYVKFLRFAHWKVETSGTGIVGLVTNHGYLDNPTFRGVRQQLLATFPCITVIDLHGNRKKKERAPDERADGNVFGIAQGTAIGLLCRPPGEATSHELQHGELWGTAEEKLNALERAAGLPAAETAEPALAIRRVAPAAPQYFFAPRPESRADEYAAAARLPDIMPLNVTAPVTARDGFVVAFSREELLARMAEFRDLNVPDDEIRRRYFTRTRSARYAAGDTRGWKLAEARRRLAADPCWPEHIQPCWYRPFDERFVYWADGMIDWPRDEVTPYLLRPGNVALVARRQMLPSQPCNYFWVTDQLLLDGLIRSDNRGSEAVFPLFLEALPAGSSPPHRVNFDEALLERAARQLGIRWDCADDSLGSEFRPADLLFYSYALFFSPEYRRRYADRLWSDFPRVLLPQRPDLLRTLAARGAQLASWHLLSEFRSTGREILTHAAAAQGPDAWRWFLNAPPVVAPGFPKFGSGRVSINRDAWLEPVPAEIWAFSVGGHQVCRKWLKDRRGRTLSERELAVYGGMLSAVKSTLRTMAAIEADVQAAGGWPTAFSRLA